MKKRLTILTCFMVLCSFVFGQSHWGDIIHHGTFDNNMSVNISAQINGINQTNSEIEVGVFCGVELRGYSNIEDVNDLGIYFLALIQVHGKVNEEFSFRLWDGESEYFSSITKVFDENGYGTLSNPLVINFFTPVAEVDGVKYPTFEAAIAAVMENSTLTLLDDVTISQKINVASNLTINGNGKTLTYTGQDRAIDVASAANGANLTVTNLTVDCNASYCQRGINYNTNGILVLEGVTVKGTNLSYALNMPGSADNATVTISNSTLKGCIALNVWGENATINATNTTFTTVDNAEHEGYAAVALNNDGTTSAEGTTINIIGGAIAIEGNNADDSSASSNATSTGVINISETTEVEGEHKVMIAIISYGDNSYSFTTLAGAIEKANADETVLLIRNAEGPGVVINKDVTIDFGGHIYTFNEGVGSTGTESNGFQILKDNEVTLKNGTLQVSSEENVAKTFYTIIQNYANLTVEDMYLDGTNLDKWSLTDGDSYVVSNNSGDVSIIGKTTIIANNDGDLAFALDACDKSAWGYALPTVTVNTTGKITGAVEVSATLNITNLGKDSEISYISIDGKGQLFHNGLTTTIKKHITGDPIPEGNNEYVDGWYTISSPVGNVNHTEVVGLLNGTHDLYRYNEADAMWENVKANEDFTTLDAGRGYIYANTKDTELSFEGTLNTAAVKQKLSASHTELTGFNLIGNPFTYNITKSNMSGASLAEGFYTLSNHGAWQPKAEDATIAPMQGALIKATEKTDNFIIAPNSAKRSGSENNGQIKIEVSNDNYNDVAYVSFNEGIGLDKINHRNAEIPMVYVPVDGVNYAIATMSQDVTEIPVSFRAMTMGQYTIGVEAQDCEYAMMTLVDRFTGEETNLLLEDYSFIAKTNDNPERFIIKLALANSNGEANENFAFINNGMMYIYNIEGQGMVNVYDVTGRPVAEYNVATSANISTSDFAAGVYIIRMSDENGIKVQKIVIE